MGTIRLRRTGALLASAALLASLTVATVAAPTSADPPFLLSADASCVQAVNGRLVRSVFDPDEPKLTRIYVREFFAEVGCQPGTKSVIYEKHR